VAMVLAAAIIGQAASENANRLASVNKPTADLEVLPRASQPFSADVLATIRANAEVELASASLTVAAETSNSKLQTSKLELLGIDSDYQALHQLELADGEFLSGSNSILVPSVIALRNGWRTGDEIKLQVGDKTVTVKISGRLKQSPNQPITQSPNPLVPLALAQSLNHSITPSFNPVDHIEIKLKSGADSDKVRAALATALGADLIVARATVGGGPSFSLPE